MSDILLGLWIALLGADRIDLAGGRAPFLLTPFLALTPIVVVSEIVRRRRESRPIIITRAALAYAAVAAALVCVVLGSVFVAEEIPISAARAFLLLADVGGTFAIALLCSDRENLGKVLARGAIVCLPLFLIFDVAETLFYIGRTAETVRFGPAVIQLGALQTAGPLPRLAGPVADANRGGFVLLFYLVVIAGGEPRVWVRRTALAFVVAFLIGTFSRSASLGAAAAIGMIVLTRRGGLSTRTILAGCIAVASVATLFLVKPDMVRQVSAILESPASRRLSTSEGSAQKHFELIGRGLDEATASVPRTLTGFGYGNSYLVLQDVFPGNRYGNFHSLYVTMFAEAGVFALVLMLVLSLTPLVLGSPWRPLVAGALAFNVFYQTTTEPAFWFMLAAAWLMMPEPVPAHRAPAPSALGT